TVSEAEVRSYLRFSHAMIVRSVMRTSKGEMLLMLDSCDADSKGMSFGLIKGQLIFVYKLRLGQLFVPVKSFAFKNILLHAWNERNNCLALLNSGSQVSLWYLMENSRGEMEFIKGEIANLALWYVVSDVHFPCRYPRKDVHNITSLHVVSDKV